MSIFLYIVLLLLIGYCILIDYYRRSWNKIPDLVRDHLPGEENIKVSVIVPARNEQNNIGNCVRSILTQSYPLSLLEIIIVDDHSTDRTAEIVRNFNQPSIQLINLWEHIDPIKINSYKKKAIEIAIQKSSGELIVTTDADCIVPVDWISSIVSIYQTEQAVFIAAPVKIADKSTLLSIFQSLDFVTMQGITGAAVYEKIFAMCNGANLAYSKNSFAEVNGFDGIDQIASGDDMFLMQKISKKFPDRVFYLKSRAATVTTQPAENWKSFLQQRTRWSSKANKYENKNISRTLIFVYLLNLCLLIFLPAAFWNINWLLIFLTLILIKTIGEFWFVKTVANFFGQGRLMRYFFFLQPLHIIYIVIAGTLGAFGSYEWKNRKVK